MRKLFVFISALTLSLSAFALSEKDAQSIQQNSARIESLNKVIIAKRKVISANNIRLVALNYQWGQAIGAGSTWKALAINTDRQSVIADIKSINEEVEAMNAEIEALKEMNGALAGQ